MSDGNSAKWVEASEAWTTRDVMQQMWEYASEAVKARGRMEVGGGIAFDPPEIHPELQKDGLRSYFSVGLTGQSVRHRRIQLHVRFESEREDGREFRSHNCIVCAAYGAGEPIRTTARLALDCTTGEPALLVGDRLVTPQEFVREILTPILFLDLVPVTRVPGRHGVVRVADLEEQSPR